MTQKFKVIRVTMEVDYVIPMATEMASQIDGLTPEEVAKSWFDDYDINSSHASRDAYRVGNGKRITGYNILDEDGLTRPA